MNTFFEVQVNTFPLIIFKIFTCLYKINSKNFAMNPPRRLTKWDICGRFSLGRQMEKRRSKDQVVDPN